MEVKVCGMREPENIQDLMERVQPDWMGLIFYPKSPRYVSEDKTAQISQIPLRKVGVFVNESEAVILQKIENFGLEAVQLHGKESPEMLQSLAAKTKAELWKVISVGEVIDWESLKPYLPYVTRFLFDTATPVHGGSGRKFDWEILKSYPFQTEFLLSGGLEEDSAAEVLALQKLVPQLVGVDLNSKFEDAPGVKNIEKLKNFKSRLVHTGTNN